MNFMRVLKTLIMDFRVFKTEIHRLPLLDFTQLADRRERPSYGFNPDKMPMNLYQIEVLILSFYQDIKYVLIIDVLI